MSSRLRIKSLPISHVNRKIVRMCAEEGTVLVQPVDMVELLRRSRQSWSTSPGFNKENSDKEKSVCFPEALTALVMACGRRQSKVDIYGKYLIPCVFCYRGEPWLHTYDTWPCDHSPTMQHSLLYTIQLLQPLGFHWNTLAACQNTSDVSYLQGALFAACPNAARMNPECCINLIWLLCKSLSSDLPDVTIWQIYRLVD